MTAKPTFGYMCFRGAYEFEGWAMETQGTGIPYWPHKKDGEPYERVPKAFWPAYERFIALPQGEREQYRIGKGGCRRGVIPAGEEK